MLKKLKLWVFGAIAAVIAAAFFFAPQTEEKPLSDIALSNIEALTRGEVMTTWECKRLFGNCEAYCGKCGAKISSVGRLRGYHTCSY